MKSIMIILVILLIDRLIPYQTKQTNQIFNKIIQITLIHSHS